MPSTVIRSFEYDEASKTLLIVFQSGRRYRYLDVPMQTATAMRGAFAKGAFFNAQIRERFAYREEPTQDHASAMEKARKWRNRAIVAHEEGRVADAARCEDKARDWSSRARQIERRHKQES